MTTWTVESVKQELPDVDVKFDGKIVKCMVRGRKNKFASVCFGNGLSFEAAWSTVTSCLNNNRPITY